MPATKTDNSKTTLQFAKTDSIPPSASRGRVLHNDTVAFMGALKQSKEENVILSVKVSEDELNNMRQRLRSAAEKSGIKQHSAYDKANSTLFFAEESVWNSKKAS